MFQISKFFFKLISRYFRFERKVILISIFCVSLFIFNLIFLLLSQWQLHYKHHYITDNNHYFIHDASETNLTRPFDNINRTPFSSINQKKRYDGFSYDYRCASLMFFFHFFLTFSFFCMFLIAIFNYKHSKKDSSQGSIRIGLAFALG